jgi:colanic acid/amylovoran biosynthesis glycosyltransferase
MSTSTTPSKKKLLFFIPDFPVISETFIEQEVSELVKRGNFDIQVFSLNRSDGYVSENLKDKVIYKKIELTEFYAVILAVFKNPRGAIETLKLMPVLNRSFFSKFFMFGKALGYSYFVDKLHPDHIHAHFLSESSSIALLISTILNVPMSISGHAKDIFVDSENIKLKAKSAKFIRVCNKNAWQRCIEESGENKNKILLQHHGINFENKFKLVKNTIKKPGKPVLFNVGRYFEKKGQEYLIKAAKILHEKGYDFVLYIAGGGPLYDNLSELIKVNLLEDKVKLLGTKEKMTTNDQVLDHFTISDIFILPSIQAESGDVDGIPNTILEAAAFKIPVISTKAGSIEEVLIDGETGLFVDQKDEKDIADKIECLLNDHEEANRLGENLHKFVLETFSFEKCMDNFESSLLEHIK